MITTHEAIAKAQTRELKQWYANARRTYFSCGGHYKAHMNKYVMELYASILRSRNIFVPMIDEPLPIGREKWDSFPTGIFNGEGSY